MGMIRDGLQSLIGRLGDPARDKIASTQFTSRLIPVAELAAAYENNWIARKAVDIPAKDALRNWRTHNGERADLIQLAEVALGLRKKYQQALISARLFGGSALFIGTDQDPQTPLEIEKIGPGGLRYVTLLTRRQLTAEALDRDVLSPTYGMPPMYRVSGGNGQVRIHPSRLAIFRGDERADDWMVAGANAGWGQSIIQSTYDAIVQSGTVNANIASLIFEANVDVIAVDNLTERVNQPGGEQALFNRFAFAAANKGINGTMILDASAEKYDRRSASLSDLSPLMEAFALFAAAANDIPATRFLARSPSGLNATGGHDKANYEDKLSAIQELQVTPATTNLDACLYRTAGIDGEVNYSWRPFEILNELELAKIGREIAETGKLLDEMGIYTGLELRELMTHRLAEVGAYPHAETIIAETANHLELGELTGSEDEPDEDSPSAA